MTRAKLSDVWGGSTREDRRRRPYDSGYADALQCLRPRSDDAEYRRGHARAEKVKLWVRG